MHVKLISITQPLIPEAKTAEELIAYCARVSNPANQANTETAPKLLRYCLTHRHLSIFEQVTMTVEVVTSRAIAAQILRHRSFTFQELSQRYQRADLGFEYVVPRRQDEKNRQNSIDDLDEQTKNWFQEQLLDLDLQATSIYEQALARGVAKECARFLLPLNVRTRLYMTGTARSWITYLETRTDPSTQKEHRDVAEAVRDIFVQQFPETSKALGWL